VRGDGGGAVGESSDGGAIYAGVELAEAALLLEVSTCWAPPGCGVS